MTTNMVATARTEMGLKTGTLNDTGAITVNYEVLRSLDKPILPTTYESKKLNITFSNMVMPDTNFPVQ